MLTMAKNVATQHFMLGTTFTSFDEMYEAFCLGIGDHVRSFFTDNVVAYTSHYTLKLDMLRDGCFLLQYMLLRTNSRDTMPPSLACYFDSNRVVIDRDIMLLENQLPWVVIQTLRHFKEVPVEKFIAKMARTLQGRKGNDDDRPFVLDGSCTPPHLLGLVRFYKIASQTTKFIDMGITKRLFCSEIFLAPLLLDETRLCWLVNMAAFELCVAAPFSSDTEKHAVCSYLVILAMLMDHEEDVHKLRSKGLVQGELSNKEIPNFFKAIVKHISGGPLYIRLMEEIDDYKLKRWMWIKVHKFIYKNYKTIAAVLSVVGVLVGIFKALYALKQH
ncbi:hypothetical protein BAE44_0010131 [Dichanthelium oligosanthes]|uniref:Uncharacterized protein n=1 Tax=Dichanthelium oligosanthes TaxID=888268 RepID=A0A1E5VUS4_9POAL|nr:hypothetical protein BAE44_0010131 [Dichanthelium oligosanthes]